MTSTVASPSKFTENEKGLVEMAWDPILSLIHI